MTMKEAAIQQPLLSNGFANKHVCTAPIGNSNRGTVFSVQSVLRCYKQDSWVNSWCKELVVGQSPANKNVSMELENTVEIRHQATTSEDTANWEDVVRAVVNCSVCVCVCELAIELPLRVVTICKCTVNLITNPNPTYSHSMHRQYFNGMNIIIAIHSCIKCFSARNMLFQASPNATQI
jgi:hypothetical protein